VFERTAPVHSAPERALFDPRLELLDHGLGVAQAARRAIGTCEDDQLVVAIRLPDDLGVACDGVIPVVEERSEPQRDILPARVVPVPLDGMAEVAIDEVKEGKPVLGYAVGLLDEPGAPTHHDTVVDIAPFAESDIGHAERPVPRQSCKSSPHGSRAGLRAGCQSRAEPHVTEHQQRAPGDLGWRHRTQTAQVPAELHATSERSEASASRHHTAPNNRSPHRSLHTGRSHLYCPNAVRP
jgi:hypothetical protein